VHVPPSHLFQYSPPLANFLGLVLSLQHLYKCQWSEVRFLLAITDLQERFPIAEGDMQTWEAKTQEWLHFVETLSAQDGEVDGSNKKNEDSNQERAREREPIAQT
jgi:hypothetical protein